MTGLNEFKDLLAELFSKEAEVRNQAVVSFKFAPSWTIDGPQVSVKLTALLHHKLREKSQTSFLISSSTGSS